MTINLNITIHENNIYEYSGEYTTTIPVWIEWQLDDSGKRFLCIYEDGNLLDGFDSEEFENRLNNGEDFEEIAKEIIAELKFTR